MEQITNHEMMMTKVIRDRWKREIEEAIDRVKYGEGFCAERCRANLIWRTKMIRCKICGQSRALIAGVCLKCNKIYGDVQADIAADVRDATT